MDKLTAERLREVLEYDPENGVWKWKVRTSLRVRIGDQAGSLAHGYIFIRVDGVLHRAHRLAWLYMTGKWPREIDHINRKRSDNRWINLREATRRQNIANGPARRGKSINLRGVYKNGKRWMARLWPSYLGTFDTPEEARAVYLAAAKRKYGEFAYDV